MPISQPLKAPDTDVQLDLIFTAGYLRQKHRWPGAHLQRGRLPACSIRTLAERREEMTNAEIGGLVAGIISILVGIAVIAWPRILAYMVGIYLIIVGIIAIVASVVSR